ncbi:glycosyltransferase family 32 protein [Pedobacter sp. SL55]|uniref:glycosyltransferase family 32 protein n=1 Tax=Pedobacter sp. SL55 TaxID=2995161 RepID=UPI00227220C7|nr:capsular polysaccharide synthesis protein [Pedobacter sp. SL55]WAC41235.1 glycosyltransferase [Pedobacter sp. SL55]
MKFKLSHRLRLYFDFLRHSTPRFDGRVKHFIWGYGKKSDANDSIPKVIWLYWNEEKVNSATVQLCINIIKNLHTDHEVHLLHRTNLLAFLPNFPTELFGKPSNFVSDMVRLMLLEQHGGIYLDATVLLSKPLNWALELQQKDCSEAVLYYADENTRDEKFPMVETWFIAALPQSTFIKAWREEYQNCMLSANSDTYYDNNDILPLSNFPLDATYYTSYMAGQIVMRRSQQYRLSLLRAEDDAFNYGLGFKKKWDEVAMADVLLFNKKADFLPNVVKLIRFDRRRLDYYIERKFYKKHSWLGELLQKQNFNDYSKDF